MLKRWIDVFLCHNSLDKNAVEEIRYHLQASGISTWLDKYDLQPSRPWQAQLDEIMPRIKTVAVFFGSSGLGPSANIEIQKFLVESEKRQIQIGLVILPGCSDSLLEAVPHSISRVRWVDFRQKELNDVGQLIQHIVRALDTRTLVV